MLYKDFYVGNCAEQFLCISEEDKADIAAGRYFLEPRIAIEMGAIRELPSFRAWRMPQTRITGAGKLRAECCKNNAGHPRVKILEYPHRFHSGCSVVSKVP